MTSADVISYSQCHLNGSTDSLYMSFAISAIILLRFISFYSIITLLYL